MPICKNNPNKTYIGNEPSPKGLGYCASGEKEGIKKKGLNGKTWIVKKGKWVLLLDPKDVLFKKLFKWWQSLIKKVIIIYSNDYKKISLNDQNKWEKLSLDPSVLGIIWTAQSSDILVYFINYLIKKNTKKTINKMCKMDNLPEYLIKNFKKYFEKYKLYSDKDYTFKYLSF